MIDAQIKKCSNCPLQVSPDACKASVENPDNSSLLIPGSKCPYKVMYGVMQDIESKRHISGRDYVSGLVYAWNMLSTAYAKLF